MFPGGVASTMRSVVRSNRRSYRQSYRQPICALNYRRLVPSLLIAACRWGKAREEDENAH